MHTAVITQRVLAFNAPATNTVIVSFNGILYKHNKHPNTLCVLRMQHTGSPAT